MKKIHISFEVEISTHNNINIWYKIVHVNSAILNSAPSETFYREEANYGLFFLYKNVRLAYSYNGKKIVSFLAVAISEWGLNKMPKKSCPFLYSESIYKYGQDLWDT